MGIPAIEKFPAASLLRRFGAGSYVARRSVRALYQALVGGNPPDLDAWRHGAGQASGDGLSRLGVKEPLAGLYGVGLSNPRADVLLFALETYYVVVVELLLGEALSAVGKVSSPAARISGAGNSRLLRREVERLLGGEIWQDLGLDAPVAGPPYSWPVACWSRDVEGPFRSMAEAVTAQRTAGSPPIPTEGDLFGPLYLDLFPRKLRHVLGEYYTPGWLVEHVLDRAGYCGKPDRRLLDPTCGAGAFLLAAVARLRRATVGRRRVGSRDAGDACRRILGSVVGCELNPLAAFSARAGLLMAVADLLPHAGTVAIPIVQADAILGEAASQWLTPGGFDYVVGNPPWVAWDNLPEEYRRATAPLWQRYGLFSLSGNAARHGGGKKDLAMLVLYAGAEKYLADSGRLSMVVTQTLFQTRQAGEGFRRFRLGPEGPPLRVERVDDLVGVRPFPDAANWTAVVTMTRGRPTEYPVPYLVWKYQDQDGTPRRREEPAAGRFEELPCLAEPVEPEQSGSAWFIRPPGFDTPLEQLFGPSDYEARLGANSGGANGVYWFEVLGRSTDGVRIRNLAGRGKQAVTSVECVVEPDLLYPLLCWGDVERYRATPSAHILLTQDVERRVGLDPAEMAARYPKTLAYLERFEPMLRRRAAHRRYQDGRAFWSMYNVGPYTVAPAKVVWRRMDRRMTAAVVETTDDRLLGRRVPVPQETCALIDAKNADEAHYVCGVLNSAIVDFLVRSHSVRGGKGFGTPGMLRRLNIRRFDPDDARHMALAEASREAHRAVAAGRDVAELQRRIDEVAAPMWRLSTAAAEAVSRWQTEKGGRS